MEGLNEQLDLHNVWSEMDYERKQVRIRAGRGVYPHGVMRGSNPGAAPGAEQTGRVSMAATSAKILHPEQSRASWVGYMIDETTITELRDACSGIPRAGGASNFVRLFKPRFAKLVKAGKKLQTIRPLPNRIPRSGDTLSLRTWKGKPYRSKQRLILETNVDAIKVVYITERGIFMQPPDGSLMAMG